MSMDATEGARKKEREKTRYNLLVPREQHLQSAAAANVVVFTAASPAFLQAARGARTRVPRLPHMSPVPACEHERPAHVGAPFACGKDVQSVGRVAPRENEGRLVQASARWAKER